MENKTNAAPENDILFTRTVKAGKRVYYLDVKRDKKGEYYLSMTESKRLHAGDESVPPVYEKHKIFLYREDMHKFTSALAEATDFISQNAPQELSGRGWLEGIGDEPAAGTGSASVESGEDMLKFGVDF